MADIRETIYQVLLTDPTLVSLATGGIHNPNSLGRYWVEIKDLIASPTNPIIRPGIFLKFSSATQFSYQALHAEQLFFEVWFIQHQGYDTIETMRERVRALLGEKRFNITSPTATYMLKIIWVGDLYSMVDDALAGASVERSRYEIHIRRNI